MDVRHVLPWLLALLGSASRGFSAEAHPIAGRGNCELHPALELSLFAREPDTVDPVALTFDEDGRVFVVEMRDYPYGFGPERKPGGTVRLLEDTDHDGRVDRSTLFAEGLSFPTSIAAWNGGVIVTAPPEIIFLKDTNGDGKADVREVLLKGFTLGVTDSNVNGLRWGLDNRLHGVNGGNGGNIVSIRRPGPAVPLRNLDFSFDPNTGDFTPTFHTSGGFGLVFDDWGRSFVTYNINHLQQRMIPVRYLGRCAGFPPVEAVTSISDHEEMSPIYPISEPETRVNHPEQSGHFSSAGGLGFIGARGYAGDLAGSILVCDVVGNLVHRDVLRQAGPIFVASRSSDELTREFFASRDRAFRPVGLELGPDGALYLIDMQRDVIEHPDYIPQKTKEKLDLRAGEDRGRIYRLCPRGGLPCVKPNLGHASPQELVSHLSDSNPWWRLTAQRLLVERQARACVPALTKLAREQNPLGRLHALWTLLGLHGLEEPQVRRALVDPHPGVRENALQLSETLSAPPESRILELARDVSPRVRFQAALTLGQFDDAECRAALRRIFLADHGYRWSRLAVLSSLRSAEDQFLRELLANTGFRESILEAKLEGVRELSDLAGARAASGGHLASVLSALGELPLEERWQAAVLEGLETGLSRSGATFKPDFATSRALEKLSRSRSRATFVAAWKLARAIGLPETDAQRAALDQARQRARDPSRPLEERLAEVRVLALGNYSSVGEALCSLLDGAQPATLQQAALEVLGHFREPEVAKELVNRWRRLVPVVRTPTLNLLLQRIPFHAVLLEAIEQDRIKLGELNLDLEQRRRLLRESSPEVMARAAKLIGDEEYSNRKAVVEDWLKKLPAHGEAARGRAVFEKTCVPCHALDGVGHQVGPDLATLASRSVEDLLSNILDPNMAINPSYISYNVETISGEIETGILQAESADSVVLLQALGRRVVLPRNQIKRLESSGLSLMPEGLEAGMTPGDLRDLIAFLQQKR